MKVASVTESDEPNRCNITFICEFCYDSFTAIGIGSTESDFENDTRYIRCINCQKRSIDNLEC